MKYVNVDVFGKCSKNFHHNENKEPCSASPDGDCFKKFMNGYKFRLAFENSLCTDYITEKFWSMYNPEFIFDVHSVPIVRGARDYQYKKDVPFENFYLNTQNFKSPKELADYLNYLDANQTAYLEFFKWKVDLFKKIEENLKNSKIVTSYLNLWFEGVTFLNKAPFCRLCEYLHNETFLSNHEHNRRWIVSEWFGPSQNCWDSDETNFALEILAKFVGYCI
ncbi:glyco 3-alpha-L-fucosyltransferase A [Brachionus plicatilis]|uniref:Fucosyltransferase n=1 Tax=Brachionus plicatilis TaxID=10195 RepID=A0A3M7RRZ4_BRAPC|nr:glyco 3-alpha-L-fucosyltransferase A [Brachionus plicatilis]